MKESKIKFGTDGWRAVIAEDFTFANLGLVTEAIAKYLKNGKLSDRGVFIGYDNRFLSEDFAKHCADCFAISGIKPYLSTISVPTPLTAFMAVELKLNGSVMITASHNPSKYNGIKFIPDYGGPAEDKVTGQIESALKEIINSRNTGFIRETDATGIEYITDYSSYKKKLLNSVDRAIIKEKKPSLAVDTMHGSSGILMPEILNGALNLDAVLLNNFRDTLFGGRLPDPSEKNLSGLKRLIQSENLDLGVALDGDADRFGAIDRKGYFISPNNAIALILYYFLETGRFEKSDIAVRTVATTHLIDEICENNKIDFKETPVGFKYIGKEMLGGNVLIGGEESGGLSIKGHIPEKDGLLAVLILIEIQSYLKKYKNSIFLSEYLEKIYERYGHYYNIRLDIEIKPEKKNKIIEHFLNLEGKSIENIKVDKINNIDGAKVLLTNKSWILIRASGTEPLIRCYIESKDKDYFVKLQEYARSVILAI